MSAQVSITQLPAAGAITGTESVPIVQNGVTVQTTTGAISGSPSQPYTYLTVNQTPQLANSRYIGATNGLTVTDGGAQGPLNVTTTGALLSLVSSGTGFQVKTSSTAITGRSIAVDGVGLSISNGDGISGNPTISLAGQVLNLANYSGNGLMTITTAGAISTTLIQGTSSQIAVTNGNGVSGTPTIGIASNPALPGLAGVVLPSGSSSDRSVAPTNGTLRYNTDFTVLEAYLNNTWTTLASGSGVTSVATGTGLTGGPITSVGTISIANTAVTAGSYTAANITVNAQGQITAASSNATLVSSFSAGSTGLTPATATTGAVTLAGVLNAASGGTGAASLTGYVYGNGTGVMTASTTIPTTALSGTVTNAQLANSSLTIGTTNIALGATTLTLGGLTSVAVTQDPVSALQLATKQYVDSLAASGIHYHEPVYVESPNTAGNLNATYNQPGGAGNGVGATLTNAGTQVALTIDGVLTTVGMRVLIYNQTNAAQNGVYTVTVVGTVSTNWVLTRATDADTYAPFSPNSLGQGDAFFVQAGSTGAGETYICNTVGVIVFGVTNITFAQLSSAQVYSAGTGLTLTGTVFSISNTAVTAGSYGLAASVPTIAINAQGQITSASNTAIAINGNQITSGTVGVAYGGTNLSSYAAGDLLYASGTTTLSKLTLGTNGYVLTAGASAPQYVAQSTLAVGSATNTDTTASSAAATHYLVFKSATTGSLPELVNSSISVYPSTGVITGGISGGTF
jgi:hypothetical protein